METVISLAAELFRRAERMQVPRNQLYAAALEEVLDRQDDAITARLNVVYSRNPSRLDDALHAAKPQSAGTERW